MLLQYGDKKRSVLAILCDRCGDEHRRMNLKEAKIVDLHEAAFAVLKSMMP
jgi:ribosomal protein L44E